MNVLTSDFPEAIRIGENVHNIDFDYKNCIQVILAWEDKELTKEEKAYITIDRIYENPEEIEDIEEATMKAIKFLNGGDDVEPSDENVKPKPRVYSFEKDSKYIYSAIDKVLGGMLSDNKPVHWWLFCMAFMEIPEECMLSKIIYYRTQKSKGKLTKDEKKIYKDMIDIFELEVSKESRLSEEQEANMNAFEEALKRGKNGKKD